MSARYEYKYMVPNAFLGQLRKAILPFVELDAYAREQDDGQYTVRSIYYDSPRFTCYQEKNDGIQIRDKFRIRGYNRANESSLVYLEIKHKHTDCISKNRAPVYYKDVGNMLKSKNSEDYIVSLSGNGIEKKDAQKFLFNYHIKNLRPAILVIYDREAFHGKFDPSLRLTFDKNLRSEIFPGLDHLYDELNIRRTLANHFIFEVKFYGSLPAWIKSIVNGFKLNRRALSKYTMSLDTHPEFRNRRMANKIRINSYV